MNRGIATLVLVLLGFGLGGVAVAGDDDAAQPLAAEASNADWCARAFALVGVIGTICSSIGWYRGRGRDLRSAKTAARLYRGSFWEGSREAYALLAREKGWRGDIEALIDGAGMPPDDLYACALEDEEQVLGALSGPLRRMWEFVDSVYPTRTANSQKALRLHSALGVEEFREFDRARFILSNFFDDSMTEYREKAVLAVTENMVRDAVLACWYETALSRWTSDGAAGRKDLLFKLASVRSVRSGLDGGGQ